MTVPEVRDKTLIALWEEGAGANAQVPFISQQSGLFIIAMSARVEV